MGPTGKPRVTFSYLLFLTLYTVGMWGYRSVCDLLDNVVQLVEDSGKSLCHKQILG